MNADIVIKLIKSNTELSAAVLILFLFLIFIIIIKLKRRKIDQKINKLREVIKKYPNFADVRCALGDLYYIDEQYKLAIIEYEASVKICPTYIRARLRLARTYIIMNELITAYLTYREASKFANNNGAVIAEIRNQMKLIRKKVPPEKIPLQKDKDPLDYI
jgi:tetratricopeptide (TPR) repeat protein